MDWTVGRTLEGPPRRPLLLSVVLHALVVTVVLWVTTTPAPMDFETFQIELVSLPTPDALTEELPPPPPEDLVIERPAPEPEPETTEALPAPDSTQQPVPEPEEPPPAVEEAPTPAPSPPDSSAQPEEASEDAIRVRLEGLQRDYPVYFANIIRQIKRCFRPPRGDWSTTVYFVIHVDGTVSDLRYVERSGNPEFDLRALGAVECAGQGRFGPLPDDLPYERLPVLFNFRPNGLGDGFDATDFPNPR